MPSERATLPKEVGDERPHAPDERPRGRPPSRLTAGSVVPVLLALLAAAFAYGALQDRSSMTSIVVANSLVPAGASVNRQDTHAVRVHSSDASLVQGLLTPAELGHGWVASVALRPGEPLTLSEVERPSLVPALGEMSIAVPLAQAAGGKIAAGDLVDVIASTGTEGAYYVAQSLRVLSVASASTTNGVLSGGGSYFVVVAVDKQTALRIAAALGAEGEGPRATPSKSSALQAKRPPLTCATGRRRQPARRRRNGGSHHRAGGHQGHLEHRVPVVRPGPHPGDHGRDNHGPLWFGAPQANLDLLVVDDIMRTFSASEIATAQELGIHVLGLYDNGSGMGREHLVRLGVDEAVPAATPPAELVALICRTATRAGAPRRVQGSGRARRTPFSQGGGDADGAWYWRGPK